MKDQDKTQEELINELLALRRQVAEHEDLREWFERQALAQCNLAIPLSAATEMNEALRLFTETAIRVSGMDCGGMYLVDDKSGALDLKYSFGVSEGFAKLVTHYDKDSVHVRLVMEGKPIYGYYPELKLPRVPEKSHEGLGSIAIVPIFFQGQVIACLNIASHRPFEIRPFTRNVLESMAAQLGDAITRIKTTETLQEREGWLRQITSHLDEVFWLRNNRENRLIYVSPAYEWIWNRPCEDIHEDPLSFAEAIHPEDRQQVVAEREKAYRGEPVQLEYRIILPNGVIRWIGARVFPIRNESGEAYRSAGVAKDITVWKGMEESLRSEKQKFQRLSENLPVGLILIDPRGDFEYCNPKFKEIFGYDMDEVANGRTFFRKMYPDPAVRDEVISAWKRDLVEGPLGEKRVREFKVTCKDGVQKTIDYISVGLEDGYNLVTCRDMTRRQQLEDALRKSEMFLSSILENAPMLIYVTSVDGRVQLVNRNWEEFTGHSREEVLHLPLDRVFSAKIAREFQIQNRHVLETLSPLVTEENLPTPHGRSHFYTIKFPLFNAQRKAEAVGGISLDITKRKEAEEEKQRLLEQIIHGREQMRELSRRLVDLQEIHCHDLSRLLHDEVGQNLTALNLNLKIIESLIPEELRKSMGNRINDSQKLLEDTITRVRDLMSELRPPVLDYFGLVAALQWYGALFSTRTGISTLVEGEELSPRLPLTTETTLFRIVQEALNNVAKHAHASQVRISYEHTAEHIRLIIGDNGIGFDPTQHPQFACESGWGLVTMRERVRFLEGQLAVETSPGKGTKIILEVPRTITH
jgi:PAS domain S-box-containing protein